MNIVIKYLNLSEPIPIGIISGIGSIGGKDGGASDAISHKKTGLICDGNNLNSIYDSVLNFFKNNNFLEYGKNAKEHSEKFYWEKDEREGLMRDFLYDKISL